MKSFTFHSETQDPLATFLSSCRKETLAACTYQWARSDSLMLAELQ